VNVIPAATAGTDSRLFSFKADPRNYHVCTLYNACVDQDRIYLAVADNAARETYTAGVELCQNNSPKKPDFCRCFARSLKPTFVKSLAEIPNTRFLCGHTWVSDH